MTRLRALVFVAVLMGGLLGVGVQPASAHTNTCTGTGVMTMSTPVFYKFLGRAAHGNFTFSLTGVCAASAGLVAAGHFMGWCDDAIGQGVFNDGSSHASDWSVEGTAIEFVGPGVYGTGDWHPDVTAGQSCVSGATQFLVNISVALT